MESSTNEVYRTINNEIYKTKGNSWWKEDSALNLLKTSVNPWRVGYAKDLLKKLNIDPKGKSALEVGSGGGILTEEICKMGFKTIGIEPAEESVSTAKNHADAEGLNITYEVGFGENLPYNNQSFDVVFCCDVLEHVTDLNKVISEISRVLKPEGIFIYDTINRTLISNIVAIKIWQEWKRWAFMPSDLHVWKMFIKPKEIKQLLAKNGLESKEQVGSKLNVFPLKLLFNLRKGVKGEWSYADLGKSFKIIKSNNKSILYGGYAIKK